MSDPADTPRRRDSAKRVASKVGRGITGTGRSVRTAGRYAFTTARRAAGAQGAKTSGLSRLIEMHAFSVAGDAAVAIALAGSLFFSMPGASGDSSRSQVALFLALTMLPFAFVAPLIGPFLDRFGHGRRWAIGGTMAIRAFLCWLLAGSLTSGSPAMFPEALGVLVMSKAYGTTKAAAVPRLLPDGFTLVKGNGRVSLAGMVGVAAAAPIAGGLSLISAEWVLRFAAALFAVATILAILLPAKVDQSTGEGTLTMGPFGLGADPDETQPIVNADGPPASAPKRLRMQIPPAVAFALRANCAPKFLYGFLLMYFAFLLQEHPINDWSPTVVMGIVAGAAAIGNFLGIVTASLVRRIDPRVTVSIVVVADVVVALIVALSYGLVTATLLGLTVGFGASLAKFALDSTIQRDVPPRVHTSAFARSDTTVQLAWVAGGFVGIGLPLNPTFAMWVVFGVLALWSAFVFVPRGRAAA